MLIKLLFTLAVIAGVVVFFRNRRAGAAVRPDAEAAVAEGGSVSPRALAYGLLGLLVAVGIVAFALNWHSANRIVTIRVISDGATADYRARHKSVKGRNFVTLDGARVALGESERMEILEP